MLGDDELTTKDDPTEVWRGIPCFHEILGFLFWILEADKVIFLASIYLFVNMKQSIQ